MICKHSLCVEWVKPASETRGTDRETRRQTSGETGGEGQSFSRDGGGGGQRKVNTPKNHMYSCPN